MPAERPKEPPRRLLFVEPNWLGSPVCCGRKPVGVEFSPPNAPLVGPGVSENIVARNGFACPAVPVACGRKPTPTVDLLRSNPEPRPVG